MQQNPILVRPWVRVEKLNLNSQLQLVEEGDEKEQKERREELAKKPKEEEEEEKRKEKREKEIIQKDK